METNPFFFPAAGRYCCLSISPRGLSSAVIFYAVAPRCFDKLNMTEKRCVIPSEVEESRGNEFFLIPRDRVFLLFKCCAARGR